MAEAHKRTNDLLQQTYRKKRNPSKPEDPSRSIPMRCALPRPAISAVADNSKTLGLINAKPIVSTPFSRCPRDIFDQVHRPQLSISIDISAEAQSFSIGVGERRERLNGPRRDDQPGHCVAPQTPMPLPDAPCHRSARSWGPLRATRRTGKSSRSQLGTEIVREAKQRTLFEVPRKTRRTNWLTVTGEVVARVHLR